METERTTTESAPGRTLRQAREARGLSIGDAAQALRLSSRIVAALEEDAYERLPGPTYVRGYLRNYAQFLGLSSQPLVDAYNNLPQASQRTEMPGLTPVRQVTSSDMLVRLGTAVVAVIVLGLAALWWSGHEERGINPVAPKSAPQSAPPPVMTGPEAPPVEAPAPRPPTAEDNTPAPVMSEKPPAPPVTEEPAAPAPPPASATSQPAAEPAAAAPAPAPASPSDNNAPLSRLVLYVHEESWADVRDAREHRLLYETIPAGRVVTVEGVAPLSVFLGNVEGVTVEFNGKPYDAMRYKRGQVARFTLGSPQG